MQRLGVAHTEIQKRGNSKQKVAQPDLLAVEEPLEIRLVHGAENDRKETQLAVTMRTPGHDFELVLGFLYSEGLLKSYADVISIKHCERVKSEEELGNVVRISLASDVHINLSRVERNFYTTSSCGVCGKSSIEALDFTCAPIPKSFSITEEVLLNAPDIMRARQNVFEHTGGLHAATLFDRLGNLVMLREDIGRHNAMDKLIGAVLVKGMLPLTDYFAVVSGRLGFELVQKALVAGIPIVGAVGAPSSLAVQLAENYGMTVAGFLRGTSFNVYTGQARVL